MSINRKLTIVLVDAQPVAINDVYYMQYTVRLEKTTWSLIVDETPTGPCLIKIIYSQYGSYEQYTSCINYSIGILAKLYDSAEVIRVSVNIEDWSLKNFPKALKTAILDHQDNDSYRFITAELIQLFDPDFDFIKATIDTTVQTSKEPITIKHRLQYQGSSKMLMEFANGLMLRLIEVVGNDYYFISAAEAARSRQLNVHKMAPTESQAASIMITLI